MLTVRCLQAGLLREGLIAVAAAYNSGLCDVALAALSRHSCRRGFHPSPGAVLAPPIPTVAQDAERFAEDTKKSTVTINGRSIEVPEGTSILHAASALGIYIPTLCTHPRLPTTPGTCRLCLVEQNGKLVPACATPVTDGTAIATDTPEVRESVRGTLSLLKADHPLDCMNCDVNGRCEFQTLIRRYNVVDGLPNLRSFSHEWDEEVQSDFEALHLSPDAQAPTTAAIDIDLEKCLRCGRCVTACGLVQEMNVLGWKGRGRERHPAVLSEALDLSKCIECGQCASVCPVGAIRERSEWRQVLDELETKRKVMVAVTAPAVRVAIGEEVGLGPGSVNVGQMVAAQRELGFDYVLDVDFAADLTIMEEGTELLQRVKAAWGLIPNTDGHGHPQGPLPMFTSCCPGWISLVEKSYPELIPNLSTCKSPQQMMGAIVKRHFAAKLGVKAEDICLVSFMPCTAKKHEAEREEQHRPEEPQDIDYVLTTREFGHLLRYKNIPMPSLEESAFDSPMGASTGAAVIFGATGGVMEAALRTAYEILAGKPLPKLEVDEIRGLRGVKEATVKIPDDAPPEVAGKEIRVAVASGIGNARHLLKAMAEGSAPEYHFIEVMACPGGCVGGGGQPKTKDPAAVLKRMGAIYSLDERSALRKSHENPEIKQLYEEFLQEPGGSLSHELLHTHYNDRSHVTVPAYTVAERTAEHEESMKKVEASVSADK